MADELEDASKMLFMMLPAEETLQKINEDLKVDISSYYKPSSELGGDFYDVAIIDRNKMLYQLPSCFSRRSSLMVTLPALAKLIKLALILL